MPSNSGSSTSAAWINGEGSTRDAPAARAGLNRARRRQVVFTVVLFFRLAVFRAFAPVSRRTAGELLPR